MEILELDIRHFGKFLDYQVPMNSGINIIYGENETGKSTIHAFIRAMFFGIDTGRGRRGEEYLLRQPWDDPAYFAGAMRIRYRDRIYRIERNFYKNDRSVRLICETSGRELSTDREELSGLLAGMNETAFCNTVFIPQTGAATDAGLAVELQRFMVNFQESRDGSMDLSAALDHLKAQKRELENRRKLERAEIEGRIQGRSTELDLVSRELERQRSGNRTQQEGSAESRIETGDEGKESLQSGESIPQEEVRGGSRYRDKAEGEGGRKKKPAAAGLTYPVFIRLLVILLGIGSLLSLACAWFAADLPPRICFILAGLLMLGLCAMTVRYAYREGLLVRTVPDLSGEQGDPWPPGSGRLSHRAYESEADRSGPGRAEGSFSDKTAAEAQEEAERLFDQRMTAWKRENERKQEEAGNARVRALTEEMEEEYRRLEGLAVYDERIRAVEMAMERISGLSSEICREAGGGLGERASQILEELTGGRYDRIALDDDMRVRINTPSRLLDLKQVSTSTMHQVYFALRIAAGEILTGNSRLPLILDEPFAMYDDERLEAVMRWLDRSGRQVILFTCQGRERQVLEEIRRGKA